MPSSISNRSVMPPLPPGLRVLVAADLLPPLGTAIRVVAAGGGAVTVADGVGEGCAEAPESADSGRPGGGMTAACCCQASAAVRPGAGCSSSDSVASSSPGTAP